MKRTILIGSVIFGMSFFLPESAVAMNHNLAWPWNDVSSPPKTPYLAFSSAKNNDMLFDSGSTIPIRVQAGLRSVRLKWSLCRNAVRTPFLTGVAEDEPNCVFNLNIPTGKLLPGFYDLRVELDTGMPPSGKRGLERRPVTGVCTFGWKVDEMPVAETRPADFKEFWNRAKKEIAAVKPDFRQETPMEVFDAKKIAEYNLKSACLPADYDPAGHQYETVESCKISIAGPDGGRIYGWLAKPQGKGPFPAMLILPGAGVNARPRPLEHARHGYLALDIQIHGMDVDLKKYPKVDGYYSNFNYSAPEKFYYYNVHKRVLMAIDHLAKRSDVDPKRLVLAGGSQGGRLGIVGAGLDNRVTAVVTCISHSANVPYRLWANSCNRAKKDGMDLKTAPPLTGSAEEKCLAYYDPMNYAPDIRCPILFNAGMIDPVSPPYGVWASFSRVGKNAESGWRLFSSRPEKEIVWLPGMGHDWSAGFDRYAWKWLDKKLNQ